MRKHQEGFTIVELVIVIAVIGILSTIGIVSYLSVQRKSRDSQRETSAIIITNALEKYYDENGQYPGCTAMKAPAATISAMTLRRIDTAILTTPNAPSGTTNSIVCTPLTSITKNLDVFSYSGDTSTTCKTGSACKRWVFSWRKETGGTQEITSRRKE